MLGRRDDFILTFLPRGLPVHGRCMGANWPARCAGAAVDFVAMAFFSPVLRAGQFAPRPDRARVGPPGLDVMIELSLHPSTGMKSSQCWGETCQSILTSQLPGTRARLMSRSALHAQRVTQATRDMITAIPAARITQLATQKSDSCSGNHTDPAPNLRRASA